MTRFARLVPMMLAALVAAHALSMAAPALAAPEGQLSWGVHITLAPTYFDPAETPGLVTPCTILYALHDALVKPMPGKPFTPSLAESWTVSKDGLVYEFILRKGAKFHNGDPVTAADDGVQVLDFVLPSPLPGNQIGLYGWGREPIAFTEIRLHPSRPRMFVAMPFSDPFESLYRDVILPEAEELGLEIIRVDEVAGPGIIFEDIKRELTQASVVIAEITAPNQNVFYELGYSHALNKPTILLAQRRRELPFDIRSYRVIFYDDTIGGKSAVVRALRQHLDAVLKNL